ncbi:TPA: CHY zinc finger protein [Streptococcus agalactiae]
MMQEYFGIGLDSSSRCYHYHTKLDIVALKCAVCQKYYACYKCHDALEEHCFAATKSDEMFPVLCGSCPYCRMLFNPNCQRHDSIYFSKE